MPIALQSDPQFEQIAFDLDDTLIDTFRQLIPTAARDACRAMIEAGLNTDLTGALNACDQLSGSHPSIERREIFSQLVTRFGTLEHRSAHDVVQAGYHAFYERKVSPNIELFPGARALLETLRTRYTLHLVTSGNKVTQSEKVRALEIRCFFASLYFIDPNQGERKIDAFRRILRASGAPPDRHLSIGNRVDTDVGEARALGWRACWIRYGEHATLEPSQSVERPDFIVNSIDEVIEKCRL